MMIEGGELGSTVDALHSAAIHLLRRVRRADEVAGLSPARLSALSVLVFGGPRTLGELARAEQVTPPTMTNLVHGLEAAGLARRRPSPDDGRKTEIHATAKGRRRIGKAREARLAVLDGLFGGLGPGELETLGRAAALIREALSQPGEG